jgi:hypothetical protein
MCGVLLSRSLMENCPCRAFLILPRLLSESRANF